MFSLAYINSGSSPQTNKQTKYICTTNFNKQIPERVQTTVCSVQYLKTKLLSLEGTLRKTAEPGRTLEKKIVVSFKHIKHRSGPKGKRL